MKTYQAYFVNKYIFDTINQGSKKATTNSGVCVKGSVDYSTQYTSTDYYGRLVEVIQLEYPRLPIKQIVLFKCEWFDPTPRGTKVHKRYGLVDINEKYRFQKYEPFIFAIQAVQVCYVKYPTQKKKKSDWLAVCKVNARSVIQVPSTSVIHTPAFQDDQAIENQITSVDDIEPGPLNDPNPSSDYEIDSGEEDDYVEVANDSDSVEHDDSDEDLEDDADNGV